MANKNNKLNKKRICKPQRQQLYKWKLILNEMKAKLMEQMDDVECEHQLLHLLKLKSNFAPYFIAHFTKQFFFLG